MIAVAILAALVAHPSSAECPLPGWFVEGVRPDGRSTCSAPIPLSVCNTRGGCSSTWTPERREIRIYCRPNERAVVVNSRRITCRVSS